jgi:geranylgeranyl diphosphate synthase type I
MTDRSVLDEGLRVPEPTSPDDPVVLLDARGRPCGTARKCDVHGPNTPLHLAVSCYVVRDDGMVLLTRRAATKRTWPTTWTNACCGHPRPGEALRDAARRHMLDEIGLRPVRLRLALPDFTYRATMDNGWVEHELCPVFVAEVEGEPLLHPGEADQLEWLPWPTLVERARHHSARLSPWSVTQVERLAALFEHPLDWVRETASPSPATLPAQVLTHPVVPADPFVRMGDAVDELIEQFMDGADLDLRAMDPLSCELTGPLRALFRAGGKRLRPALVDRGHAAADGPTAHDDIRDLTHVAAAVEMLHTFALVHDDIMDQSVMRRGSPTAHVHFAEMHGTSRQGGDGPWFGASAAIVAGDLAFVWADELLDRLRCSVQVASEVRRVFNLLRREVIAGQYLDLRLSGPCATDRQALNVALLKSARYTVTRPLELGAALGHAPVHVQAALRTFGDAVGIAFQLRDDVLGVFGDPCVTGKGVADDLRSGKASLLLVRALELAAPADRALLRRCLGSMELDADDCERCREAVLASGALASVEALIAAKLHEAESAVDPLPHDVRGDLMALGHSLAHRLA